MLRWLLLGSWLLGVTASALAGFSDDSYLEHVAAVAAPHSYDASTTLWVALFITIQVAISATILSGRPLPPSWKRALCAWLVSFGFLFFGVGASMHSPPAWSFYVFWLLAFWAVMFGLLVWSLLRALRAWARSSGGPFRG
jgi:hypothetical protein